MGVNPIAARREVLERRGIDEHTLTYRTEITTAQASAG